MNKLVLQIYASIICAVSILFLAIYLYSMTLATISLIFPKYFNVVSIDKFSNDKENIKKNSNYKTEFEKNASLQNIKYQNIQDITKSLIVIFIVSIILFIHWKVLFDKFNK